MNLLFLAFLLLAGVVNAEIIHFQGPGGLCADTESGYVVPCPDGSDRVQTSTTTFSKSEKDIVQDNLCPGGWKESRMYIEETIPPLSKDVYMHTPVDICPDNGLLRVRP